MDAGLTRRRFERNAAGAGLALTLPPGALPEWPPTRSTATAMPTAGHIGGDRFGDVALLAGERMADHGDRPDSGSA